MIAPGSPRPSRHGVLGTVLLAALVILAGLTVPAASAGAEEPPVGSPRIVGGEEAPTGAWPSMAAILRNGNFRCGGTVVGASWVLTAAHCLHETSGGAPIPVDEFTVRTGSQQRSSGGTVHEVYTRIVIDGYTPDPEEHRDVALLQLETPTSAPPQAIVASGKTFASGTPAVATGWGATIGGGGVVQDLRQVTVSIISDQQCREAGWGTSIISSSMLCAGGQAGKDTCSGDSGGPLVVKQGGTWIQVGITSWGAQQCGSLPGVYTDLTAFSSWVRAQIRHYGPHSGPVPFVRSIYRDLFRRDPTGAELVTGVAALDGGQSPAAFATNRITTTSYHTRMGGLTRLYRGFFLRNPDTAGMAYWWQQVMGGRSLWKIADFMATSNEFRNRYGHLGDSAFVDLVYQNVLGRAPDPDGAAFWRAELSSGRRTRGKVMLGFTESPEYVGRTRAEVDVIITFFGLLRRVPTTPQIDTWKAQATSTLVDSILRGAEYDQRY